MTRKEIREQERRRDSIEKNSAYRWRRLLGVARMLANDTRDHIFLAERGVKIDEHEADLLIALQEVMSQAVSIATQGAKLYAKQFHYVLGLKTEG